MIFTGWAQPWLRTTSSITAGPPTGTTDWAKPAAASHLIRAIWRRARQTGRGRPRIGPCCFLFSARRQHRLNYKLASTLRDLSRHTIPSPAHGLIGSNLTMKRMLFVALLWMFSLPGLAFDLQSVAVRPAPPLVVPIATGGIADLAHLRGRVVLVNYWASWCPPCLLEMPSMDRLARIMGRRPFVVLAVNAGESSDRIREFIQGTHPSFPVGLDEGGHFMHAWGALAMPSSFLVDKAGRIRYSRVGPVEWDSPAMVTFISRLMTE